MREIPVAAGDVVGRIQAALDAAWMLSSASLVLLMLAGFALVTCGLVRRKNAAHLVMLNLAAFIFSLLAYYAVGFAFEFGGVGAAAPSPGIGTFFIGSRDWGFVGGRGFFLNSLGSDGSGYALAAFKSLVMATTGFVIVGAICERITFWAFVLCEVFVGALLHPLFGCWVWGGGWLSQLGSTASLGHGYVDFAGSTVVHAVGGFAAMALALVLGPRIGKFGPRGEARAFPAHNVVYVVVGTVMLLCGWLGFDAGAIRGLPDSRVPLIIVNTALAGAAGAATAIGFWSWSYGQPDISVACNGLLAGLVAISAGCAFIGPTAAVLIGGLAGLLASTGVIFNDRTLKIDDPCGAIAVHGYCGWFGAVAVGLFADGTYGAGWNGIGAATYLGHVGQGITGLFHGDVSQFLVQLGGATLSSIYAFAFAYVVIKMINLVRPVRVPRDVELEGLDLPEFGMLAYPEEGSPIS